MEEIYFRNSHGQRLSAVLSGPDSGIAIMICHGIGSNKDKSLYVSLQDYINAQGIATLRLDFLGHGKSDGKLDDFTLTEAIDDILCAKRELEKKDYTRIGFIGSSFGGAGGLMAASVDKFEFLVLISPPTYYGIMEIIKSSLYFLHGFMMIKKDVNPQARLNMKFFKDYGSHDSYAAAEKILSPVLLIHGEDDKLVPLAKSRELSKRLKKCELKVFKGADHQYTKVQDGLLTEIVNFVHKQATC